MKETGNIVYSLFKVDLLWFETYSSENPDLEEMGRMSDDELDDPENPMYVIGCGYDFGMNSKGEREFYVDTLVKLPYYASMTFRSRYQVEVPGNFKWEYLFTPEHLRLLVDDAIQNGFNNFNQQCERLEVKLPEELTTNTPTTPPQEIDRMTTHLIEDYFHYRQPFLQTNAKSLQTTSIGLPPLSNWQITINLTLLIMDEILFYNRHFNRRNNREKFFAVVPEYLYYSVRNKCGELKKQQVAFNQVEMYYFLIAQDCALQMAMSDKADALNDAMLANGFVAEVQKIWYTGASKLIEKCRGPITEADVNSTRVNWNQLIC